MKLLKIGVPQLSSNNNHEQKKKTSTLSLVPLTEHSFIAKDDGYDAYIFNSKSAAILSQRNLCGLPIDGSRY